MVRCIARFFQLVGLVVLGTLFSRVALAESPAVAFYYGSNPPWDELQAFDLVVVDPDHVVDPNSATRPHTRIAAYVALGEVQASRNYAKAIPKSWLMGENKNWGSLLIDQSQPEWHQFFTDQVIAPLWERGFRTFFLDTLDSYHLFTTTPEQRAQQEDGMVAVIASVARRFPNIKLVFNRGFEILPRTHQHVEMVVAESLFRGYDAGKKQYVDVAEPDRQWLLAQLLRARDEFNLTITVIDYVPASQREQARQTAKKILELGFVPWVSSPDLASLGVGSIEVMPRKVLVVHSTLADEYQLRAEPGVRLGSMPLNYLGYVPEFVDASNLPDGNLVGRYAGVVVWLTQTPDNDAKTRMIRWLTTQVEAKLPLALLNPPDFLFGGSMAKVLGFTTEAFTPSVAPVEIVQQSAHVGFEITPRPGAAGFRPINVVGAEPLLTLRQGEHLQKAVALTPWGGYAMEEFSVITLPGDNGDRWIINPFTFLQASLRLPVMPIPDTTTESGRRMLMVHMDGDGFISRSELTGNPLAGEVVLNRVVKKYALPMTISVIEAELSPTGLYPELSPSAEAIAQEIFKRPNVAMASHSYSHPSIWRKAAGADVVDGYNLRIPGYRFNARREIEGSVRYIESRLAPVGKKVEVFLWTGDCVPGSDVLELTRKAGILNMNGGDTVATRSQPTVTRVEGLGVPRKSDFQVYAPNQNENVYTNNWTGPFYGYERVIETFEFTEAPRRLKPINIYFHTYITTKAAGIKSLDKVFAYALTQQTTPVFVADYARKVIDFQSLTIAKTPSGWRVRGATQLRTLRFPAIMGSPDLAASQAVAGFTRLRDDVFVHLSADSAELVLNTDGAKIPRLVSSNGRIAGFEKVAKGFRWELAAHVPLQFSMANVRDCRVRVGGRDLTPIRVADDTSEFQIKDHAARPLEAICAH